MNQKARIQQISSLLLSFLTIVLISSPSYSSGITSNANSATCNNSTLETYTGTSNLQANWSANTIELHWYNDNTEITGTTVPSSCIYSGALNPPTGNDIPTKTGYTFAGWRVRQPSVCPFASSVCGLNGSAVNGLTYSNYGYNNHDGQNIYNTSTYGLTIPGTWAVEFSNGGVARGVASCNSTQPTGNTMWETCNTDAFRLSNEFSATASGQGNDKYCWCKMESYTPSGGSTCNIASHSWVFNLDADTASACASYCASRCVAAIENKRAIESLAEFRRGMFGVSQ